MMIDGILRGSKLFAFEQRPTKVVLRFKEFGFVRLFSNIVDRDPIPKGDTDDLPSNLVKEAPFEAGGTIDCLIVGVPVEGVFKAVITVLGTPLAVAPDAFQYVRIQGWINVADPVAWAVYFDTNSGINVGNVQR